MTKLRVGNAALSRLFVLLAAAAGASFGLGQEVIPPALVGSYDLTMQATNVLSPIRNGAGPIRIEISPEGLLCTDGLPFGSFTTRSSSPQRLFWTNTAANLEFSVASSGSFAGISLASASGTAYGTLTGPKVSDIADSCGELALHNSFFELAETAHPTLFPGSIFVFTQQNDISDFRYYPSTDLYLAVENDGQVVVSGGEFGSGLALGNVQDILDAGTFDVSGAAGPAADPYYVSTYTLTLTDAAPFSPIPANTTLTFVLMPDFTLCVGETVLSPTFGQGVMGGVTWYNPEARYFYELERIPTADRLARANEGTFFLFNANGLPYGTFTGERTSLSTECPDALGDNPDLPEIDLMLSLAEQRFPDQFPGGPQTFNQRVNGSVYRYYRSSDIMVRVSDRQVFVTGGTFGSDERYLGSLDAIISNLRNQAIAISVPASLTGTFGMTFTAAGPYVQIPDQTGMDLAIDQNGSLCLDGVVLMTPYLSPANPAIIRWENPAGGFVLELDTSSATPQAMALTLTSSQGQALGTLAGAKALMFPVCAGVLGNGVELSEAQELFDLAEQYLSAHFPPSALTHSRFEGNKLLRYYPASGVMLTLQDGNVEVSGGAFGPQATSFGSIAEVTALIRERFNLAQLRNVTLDVEGTLWITLSNSAPLARPIEINRPDTSAPADTERATLIQVVEQVLGNEISGSSEYTFTVVTNDANSMVFDVLITNYVSAGLTRIRRDYDLRFTYAPPQ